MRLFPKSYEGISEAFPEPPPPLFRSNIVKSIVVGGGIGLAFVSVGSLAQRLTKNVPGLKALSRRGPAIGLPIAAYTALTLCIFGVPLDYDKRKKAMSYLEKQGLKVPPRKFVERVGHLDMDDCILAGAAFGMALAATRGKLWKASIFAKYGGTACIGAFTSLGITSMTILGSAAEHAIDEYKPKLARARALQQTIYGGTLIDTLNLEGPPEPPLTKPPSRFMKTASSSPEPPQETPKRLSNSHGTGGGYMPPDVEQRSQEWNDREFDKTDPRPHWSHFEDGERVFRPETNYECQVGENAPEVLRNHIEQLTQRRKGLTQEAELIWHRIAVKEAEFYSTVGDADLKEHRRHVLEVLGDIHVNLWLEIGTVDWMIADSNKNILQVQAAMKEKSYWIPPLPANAAAIIPRKTLKLLEIREAQQEDAQAELGIAQEALKEALSSPDVNGDELLGPRTQPAEDTADPMDVIKALLKAAEKEQESRTQALEEVRAELKEQGGLGSRS